VQSDEDVTLLEVEVTKRERNLRRIRIRPRHESLFRDKGFAQRIGVAAKALGAVIELEGGLLSHTYYLLCRTGAQVEIFDPFIGDIEAHEFNKLVRDRIPKRIANLGEEVSVKVLKGDELIQALRNKLVEESFEALDAKGYEGLIEELADVLEVVDGLRRRLGLSAGELSRRVRDKRKVRGGFNRGVVLLETHNPALPSQIDEPHNRELFEEQTLGRDNVTFRRDSTPAASNPQRSIDRREHTEGPEGVLTLHVPVSARGWTAYSGDYAIIAGPSDKRNVRARIVARREGATMRLEISLIPTPSQLEFELNDPRKGR